jgi:hypothetical protein
MPLDLRVHTQASAVLVGILVAHALQSGRNSLQTIVCLEASEVRPRQKYAAHPMVDVYKQCSGMLSGPKHWGLRAANLQGCNKLAMRLRDEATVLV